MIVVAGYAGGLVPGRVMAPVGGLALATFGRGLLQSRDDGVLAGASLAAIAGALGVAALRWGSVDLTTLRAVQAVLGPTLLVGPPVAGVACWLGAIGGTLALGVWLSTTRPETVGGLVWGGVELAVAALALTTIFWGPALPAPAAEGDRAVAVALGGWGLITLLVAAAAAGVARMVPRTGWWRAATVAAAATAAATAAVLVSVAV